MDLVFDCMQFWRYIQGRDHRDGGLFFAVCRFLSIGYESKKRVSLLSVLPGDWTIVSLIPRWLSNAGRRLHTRRSFWRTGACNAEKFSKKGANYYLQQMKWIIESCLKPEFSNRPSKNHKSEEKRTITVCQSSQLSNRQRKSFTRESDWLARHFFAPELSNHLEKWQEYSLT